VRVPVEGPLVTNQVDVALDACTRGLGLARFLSYQVAQPLARGTLRRVLAGHEPPARAVQLVRPPSRFVPSRVRAFLDLATPRLREQLAAKAATRR
jgi:DNA-binding transcriptional LysR family regulator